MAVITTPKEIRPGDRIIYIDDLPVIRAQRAGVSPNFNNTELNEVGSDAIIESIADTITTQVTLETNSIGYIDILQKLMSEKATVPRHASTNTNSGVVTQADFEYAVTDFAMALRETDTFRRSVYVPNCYLTGFDFSYSVDGVSTENYTMLGDVDYDAAGAWKDLRIGIGEYDASTNTSGFVVSGVNLESGYSGLQLTINNVVVATGADITLTDASSDTQVTYDNTGITNTANGDRFRLIYYKTTPDTFATKISSAGVDVPGYGGVFGRQVFIYFGSDSVTSGVTDKMLRVQSCTINGDLSREELKELGNSRVVNKRLNTPLRLNCSIDVAESDLESFAKMVGGSLETTFSGYKYADGTDGILLNSSQLGQSNKLIVNIYKERSDNPTTLLKSIVMSGLYITGRNRDASSTARGTVSYSFQGSYISISGTGVDPLS